LTTGDIARIFDEPHWKIRRIVDSLPGEIHRIGRYRAVSRELLPQIGAALEERKGSSREVATT
jgi:hypothetical protein